MPQRAVKQAIRNGGITKAGSCHSLLHSFATHLIEGCFGLRVRGDSMIGANIADGDIAIIRPQKQVNNGEIAAVLVEDLLAEATLKIVQRTKTALTLKSANPTYRSLVFRYSGRERVPIIGKYVGIIRRIEKLSDNTVTY